MWSWLDNLQEVPHQEWDALLRQQARPSPFMSPQFLLPWCRSFAPTTAQKVGIWRSLGRLRGLIAFYEGPQGWELCGGQDVADRLDALIEPGAEGEFWSEFFEQAARWNSQLNFPNLAEDSPLLSWLRGQSSYDYKIDQTDSSPFLRLPANFEEYVAGLTAKNRHELRRKLRRAETAVRFEVKSEETDVASWLPAFFELHRLSNSDKEQFMTPAMEKFFLEMAAGFAQRGQVRIGFLLHKAEPIASMLQLDFADQIHLYNSGYNPSYAQLSPGLVLLAHCIQNAIGLKRSGFDFLRGTERYKYDLGGSDRGVFRAVCPA